MTQLGRSALVVLALASTTTACGSTRSSGSISSSGTTSRTVPTSTTTSVPLQVTVPDCGAGAYRPSTLLIVCAIGGTMATGIQWTSWSTAGARGVGTVHLQTGTPPLAGEANLTLSDVTDKGTAGPQFSRLTVDWIGRSPDGHTTDSYKLGNGS